MDPVTHIAAGALAGRLAESRFGKRHVFWYCVGAAWLPDIDNLIGFMGPQPYLLYHRGITHSVIGGVALALLLAAGFKLFSKHFPFAVGFLVGYTCIAVHIFLDVITSYGTQILSPLTTERYSMNAVFIVDPLFTVAIILFLVSARLWKKYANRIAIAGLSWVLLYPMLCFGVKAGITRYYVGRLGKEGMPHQRLELTTEAFSPFLWKLVVEDEEQYYLAGVNLFAMGGDLTFKVYSKPPRELVEVLEKEISMLKTYLWFAEYPVSEFESTSGENQMVFNDLRFFSTVSFLERSSRSDRAPFSLAIELDSNGSPLNWQYRRPGGAVVIHYLE